MWGSIIRIRWAHAAELQFPVGKTDTLPPAPGCDPGSAHKVSKTQPNVIFITWKPHAALCVLFGGLFAKGSYHKSLGVHSYTGL